MNIISQRLSPRSRKYFQHTLDRKYIKGLRVSEPLEATFKIMCDAYGISAILSSKIYNK